MAGIPQISVQIGNSDGEALWLDFSVRQSSAAQRWAECVAQAIDQSQIHKPDQWYNFPSQKQANASWIVDKISHCAARLNSIYGEFLPLPVDGGDTQAYVNKIHIFFADAHLKAMHHGSEAADAWDELNRWLHAYESCLRSAETQKTAGIPEANFLVTWKNPFHRPLEPEDYGQFTVAKKFGTCYVNYCQIGRHLYEMFLAQDECAEDEHILPLRRMGADAYFWFGSTTGAKSLQRREEAIKAWFLSHEARFNKLGFKWGDPTLAIGWLPVADLQPGITDLSGQLRLLEKMAGMERVLALKAHSSSG